MKSMIFSPVAGLVLLFSHAESQGATLMTSTRQASAHSQKGKADVSARADDLVVTHPNHSHHLHLGGSDLSELNINKNRNGTDTVKAAFVYTLEFEIVEGETAEFDFDLAYSIGPGAADAGATITWNLQLLGDIPIQAIAGQVNSGNHRSIETQSLTLGQGTYRFTLNGEIPQESFTGNQKGMRKIDVHQLDLNLTSSLALQTVPEPATPFLSALVLSDC
jgi:hypothetical protein